MINLEHKLSEVSYTIEWGYDDMWDVEFSLIDYKVLDEIDTDNLSGRVTYEISTDNAGPVEINTTFKLVDGELIVDLDSVDWTVLEQKYVNHDDDYYDDENYGDDDYESGDDW